MSMKAKNLDDVFVYRKALAAADEVSAMLERPVFRKDLELDCRGLWPEYGQANGRLLWPGTRFCARIVRASRQGGWEKVHFPSGSNDIGDKYVEISKMLTPWINYLQRCNWKSRGVRPPDLPGDRPDPPDMTAD